jgi:hypothetical protein
MIFLLFSKKAQNKKGKAAEKQPKESKAQPVNDPAALSTKITEHGNTVRDIKSRTPKAPKVLRIITKLATSHLIIVLRMKLMLL